MEPSDFHLFGPLNKYLAGKPFVTDIDVKQALTYWLQTLDAYFFYIATQALVPRWNKRLCVNGDYVEV
jgi:hypothetical protein